MVEAYSGDLYRYAYWLCFDRHTAEDLVQETFARAWRSLDGLRDDKAAKAWLMTTLRRENARRFERELPAMVDLAADLLGDPHPGYDTRTEAFALRRALAELPEDYREPLLLQVIGGYDGNEIATLMGLSHGAVMTRLFRARQKLRSLLEDEAEPALEDRAV